nr:TIGR03089 family protein [Arsenicicoccus dermatophilus]
MQSGDTSQPAITCYDRSGGPTDGERIELSGRVLLTWAAKAAGALQDELLVEPGTTVGLALPPHWRVGYWALATWWVGATLVTGPQAATADVLVTDDVALAADHHGEQVLVTLAGLARSHPGPVPAGVMDEARELASCPDRFVPLLRPAGADLAWRATDRARTYAEELPGRTGRALVVASGAETESCLRSMVEHWAGGGSVVLVRSADAVVPAADVAAIRVAERVTD